MIDQSDKKIKNWEKNWTFLYIQGTLGLAYFCYFWGKTWFSKNLPLSYTTPHGPLTLCWVPGKTKLPIPKKLLNRRTDRPYSYDPSGHGQESYKRISQLSGIAVDNKDKIQYNSA